MSDENKTPGKLTPEIRELLSINAGLVGKIGSFAKDLEKIEKEREGKTLIGTCGDCKFYNEGDESVGVPDRCLKGISTDPASGGFMENPLTFGCRPHWKEKG